MPATGFHYARRRPELTTLYEVVRDNRATLYAAADAGLSGPLPGFVRNQCAPVEHPDALAPRIEVNGEPATNVSPSCSERSLSEARSTSRIVYSSVPVKFWQGQVPSADALRPDHCVACGVAARDGGGKLAIHGHGLRCRVVLGPVGAGDLPEVGEIAARRFRCLLCGAIMLVVPAGVLRRCLYLATAIALAPQSGRSPTRGGSCGGRRHGHRGSGNCPGGSARTKRWSRDQGHRRDDSHSDASPLARLHREAPGWARAVNGRSAAGGRPDRVSRRPAPARPRRRGTAARPGGTGSSTAPSSRRASPLSRPEGRLTEATCPRWPRTRCPPCRSIPGRWGVRCRSRGWTAASRSCRPRECADRSPREPGRSRGSGRCSR